MFGMFSTHTESGVPLLAKLDEVVTAGLGFTDYTADVDNKLNMVLFTLSLMIGTAGLPHVIIRFFTVPKVADARWSAGWALVFIALLYLTAPAVGSMARLNLATTIFPEMSGQVEDYQEALENPILYEERPDWVRTWEDTGLITFTDHNNDGRIQMYNDANPGFQAIASDLGWAGNELEVNNDILVLANPEIANLPGWVIGLIAAGGIAAALSTAAGLLLAISSAISHDLIKNTINPNITEKGEMLAARISMAGAILLATYLGLNPPGFAAQVVALAFGIAGASLFPALMMGIFSTRINNKGAIAGMLAGLIVPAVHLHLPGLVLHSGHQHAAEHSGQLAVRHLPALLRRRGCDDQLRRGLRGLSLPPRSRRRKSRTWCTACVSRKALALQSTTKP
jgi:cation/acetate symporter